MKTSTVLKRAKKMLAVNYSELKDKTAYICYSIDDAAEGGKVTHGGANRVRDIVQDRLSPNSTLEGWLRDNHGIYSPGWHASDEACIAHKTKVQETRHAWVDSMIAEFEAKGD